MSAIEDIARAALEVGLKAAEGALPDGFPGPWRSVAVHAARSAVEAALAAIFERQISVTVDPGASASAVVELGNQTPEVP